MSDKRIANRSTGGRRMNELLSPTGPARIIALVATPENVGSLNAESVVKKLVDPACIASNPMQRSPCMPMCIAL